jgi:hypothetical protein
MLSLIIQANEHYPGLGYLSCKELTYQSIGLIYLPTFFSINRAEVAKSFLRLQEPGFEVLKGQ